MVQALTSPVSVFFFALAAALTIYGIGSKIAARSEKSPGKLAPYACGEDLPAERARMSIRLYNYAAMFLVLDVVSVVIALSMRFPFRQNLLIGSLAITYILLTLVAVMLVFRRR